MGDLVLSWSPYTDAVNYVVAIKHQETGARDSQTTPNTTITFYNKPTGTYSYKVTAVMPDGTTNIIIEDVQTL